ncbi:MAG: NAD(P)/FAD-dependent oxidoreductase [Verrucomicrobiota bacterium]|nr:NAD(P)/FAD-dependent oxidoreductase [Verrucomicrobiota bacterium]
MSNLKIAVIGGGAAGYFGAITAAEANPSVNVIIFEQSKRTLTKVKISGGGRCNVTHKCFDPNELTTHYPRGGDELRGAFHRWQPQDTINWFAARGIAIKAEPDGRMFPTTDDSQTIIDCFHQAAQVAGVQLRKECGIKSIKQSQGRFIINQPNETQDTFDKLLVACGSLKSSSLTNSLEALGHTITPLAPSLFAFNLSDKRTQGLSGLVVKNATVSHMLPPLAKVYSRQFKPYEQTGPILITHRGLSGPAILRLSAWQARAFQEENYHFKIKVNWLGRVSEEQIRVQFNRLRNGKTEVKTKVFDQIPRRFWERLVEFVGIPDHLKWAQLPREKEASLIQELISGHYSIQGKTTNKDEFVTCGGVNLNEINFKTMESRLVPGLHFAGECLDIDGITGGFNFQAAWTGGRLAGLAMAESI